MRTKFTLTVLIFSFLIFLVNSPALAQKQASSETGGSPARGEHLGLSVVDGLKMFEAPKALPGWAFGFGDEKLWRASAGFRYKAAYDSNVKRRRKDRPSDVIFSYIPTVAISRTGAQFMVKGSYQMEFKHFLKEVEGSSFNHWAAVEAKYTSEKATVTISDKFRRNDTRPSSEEATYRIVTSNDFNTELIYHLSPKVSVSAMYQNYIYVQGETRRQKDENQNTNTNVTSFRDRDYVLNEIGGRIYYHINPELEVYLQGQGYIYTYRTGLYDSSGFNIFVGSQGKIGKKITVSGQIGVRGRIYKKEVNDNYYILAFQGIAHYQMSPKFDMALKFKRDNSDSISLNQVFYGANWVDLEANYQITPLIKANGGVGLQLNNYPHKATRDGVSRDLIEFFPKANAGLSYFPIKNLEVRVAYFFRCRNSSFNERNYVDHYVEGSIGYKF